MQLILPPKRKDSEVGLIPLINIVFLLLIFFMIAGSIAPSEVLSVEPPISSSDSEQVSTEINIVVSATGVVAINNTAVERAAIVTKLKQLQQETNGDPLVLLKADRNLASGELQNLLQILRKAGVSQLELATRRR
jgi:biopolymer transport protein ExbD